MRVFFLSDLHLSSRESPATKRLVGFLREIPQAGDLLLLGGDIFDLFVGNKAVFREKFSAVIDGIQSAAHRGCIVHYLEGNHDFHMAQVFDGQVKVHSDEFEVQALGRKILVSHGDLIDPEDTGYRFLRAALRNPILRFLVKIIPGAWIDGIGRKSSKESRKYTDAARVGHHERLRKLYLDFAREQIERGAKHVLVGHSHLADQIVVADGGGRGEYLNLGFSSSALPYAELDGEKEFFSVKTYP